MKNKRLFLFAGYDKSGIVLPSLIFYVSELAKVGDVVFFMDSDCTDAEIAKLTPFVLFAGALRHGEYDFGSYKRAYLWARDAGILNDYEYVYLVNDSVYGPFFPLADSLQKMESSGTDAFGLVQQHNSEIDYIQSWFIGCGRSVFLSKWFDEFMNSVKKQDNKGGVAWLYEKGFTRHLMKNNHSWSALYKTKGRGVYNKIRGLYRRKMPFVKKISITRCNGALGGQFAYVFHKLSPDVRNMIMQSAYHTYGHKYMDWFLTRNPLRIMWRRIKHIYVKLFIEGI